MRAHNQGSAASDALVREVDDQLRAHGDVARAEHDAGYLKSALTHYGCSVPVVRRVAKHALAHQSLEHDAVLAAVASLWSAPIYDRRLAAVEMLSARSKSLRVDDLALLEDLVREARTWALVDPLAYGPIATIVEAAPDATAATLDRWAGDDDFWVRRSALLALLPALRRGGGDWKRFCHYADAMLDEREFFIRKAIGWVLRDTGRRRPGLVAAWLEPRAARASGVTWREAIKPLDDATRSRLEARRAHG